MLDLYVRSSHSVCMKNKTSMKAVAAASVMALVACNGGEDETREDETMSEKNNRIDYVEFAAADLAAVKTFYGDAFGWEFQDWGPEYVSFSGAGVEGGFNAVETPVVGTTLVILYADDLEATEARVVAAGGEVTERHEFPGGRRFHFRDPGGNVLGVWTEVKDAD